MLTVSRRVGGFEMTGMKRKITWVLLAALLAYGCGSLAHLYPPSEEKTPQEKLADENARLKVLYETEHELNMKLAYELEVTRIKLEKAHSVLITEGREPAEAVIAFQDFEASRIQYGLLTGVSDWDGEPGADGLRVYLLVKDSEGTTLKRKGNCRFDLIDISNRRDEVIMSWSVPAEVFGGYWHSLPPGFRVLLPWKGEVPWGGEVALRTTFTDSFGRVFQVSRIFKIERDATVDEEEGDPDNE